MANGLGISESIVNAPIGKQAPYWYRSGMGMVPSAEWNVVFDDFNQLFTTNVPTGWTAAVIDTGATVIQHATAATHPGTGAVSFVSSTASEGAAIYLPRSVQLRTGKKCMVEVKVYTDDVTDNALQFGLTDVTATTNPEDLWTTAAANVIAFGILDGAATTSLLVDEGNGGTSASTGTRSLTAATWHTLAIYYDGVGVYAFVDGKLSASETTAANIPENDILLAPFVGALNGNGAGGNLSLCDYIRVISER